MIVKLPDLKCVFLLFAIFLITDFNTKAQQNIVQKGNKFKKLENAYKITYSENNKFYTLKINTEIKFNNQEYKTLYINQEGWITFDKNTNGELKAELTENNISFISPYTLINEPQQNYSVKYKTLKDYVIIEWSETDFAFQTCLYENGKIEFRYSDNFNIKARDFIAGVINKDIAVGNFPFSIPKKTYKVLSAKEINSSNSFIFNMPKT